MQQRQTQKRDAAQITAHQLGCVAAGHGRSTAHQFNFILISPKKKHSIRLAIVWFYIYFEMGDFLNTLESTPNPLRFHVWFQPRRNRILFSEIDNFNAIIFYFHFSVIAERFKLVCVHSDSRAMDLSIIDLCDNTNHNFTVLLIYMDL